MKLKMCRELQKEFPFVQIEPTNGGHIRIRLPNGRSVFAAMSPSCPFVMRKIRRQIKIEMKEPQS